MDLFDSDLPNRIHPEPYIARIRDISFVACILGQLA